MQCLFFAKWRGIICHFIFLALHHKTLKPKHFLWNTCSFLMLSQKIHFAKRQFVCALKINEAQWKFVCYVFALPLVILPYVRGDFNSASRQVKHSMQSEKRLLFVHVLWTSSSNPWKSVCAIYVECKSYSFHSGKWSHTDIRTDRRISFVMLAWVSR